MHKHGTGRILVLALTLATLTGCATTINTLVLGDDCWAIREGAGQGSGGLDSLAAVAAAASSVGCGKNPENSD